MPPLQIVIDTHVLICALRSRRGPSFRLHSTLGDPRWQANVFTALLLEYEEKLLELRAALGLTPAEITRSYPPNRNTAFQAVRPARILPAVADLSRLEACWPHGQDARVPAARIYRITSTVLDMLARRCRQRVIYFHWRPRSRDRDDDFLAILPPLP